VTAESAVKADGWLQEPTGTGRADRLVVYLPPEQGDAAEAFARRVAAAAERACGRRWATSVVPGGNLNGSRDCYQVRLVDGSPVSHGNGAGSAPVPLVDVVGFDYRGWLFAREGTESRGRRLVAAFLTTAPFVARWPRACRDSMRANRKLRRTNKGDAESPRRGLSSVQLLFGLVLGLGMLLYLLLLVLAALTVIVSAVGPTLVWGRVLQSVVVILTALLAVIPISARRAIERFGDRWSLILRYVAVGEARDVITGNLDDLLGEAVRVGYTDVSVVGYSMGSVVALDTLFPPAPTDRTIPAQVDSLITIGCPYDSICGLYPGYFAKRSYRAGVPKRWVNVFNPVDVLSSNFRCDSAIYAPGGLDPALATQCIAEGRDAPKPDNLIWNPLGQDRGPTLGQVITWLGLRSHAMYWNSTFQGDHGCVGDIIDVLVGTGAIPRPPR
jgi:uncharacterized membrane protein